MRYDACQEAILAPGRAPGCTARKRLAPSAPYDAGALIRSALLSSGLSRAEVVRRIALATNRTAASVSVGLTKAMGRPDAGAEVLRLVLAATGRRATTEPIPPC